MESLANVVDVSGIDSSNWNSTIRWHVNGVFIDDFFDHFWGEASVSKHTDLLGNVRPIVLAAEGLQSHNDLLTELSQSLRHVKNFWFPKSGQFFVAEDGIDDSGTVNRRIGVLWEAGLLESGLNDISFGSTATNQLKRTGSFAIETEVLGEGLGEHDSQVFLSEEFERISILIDVITSKTLVSAIEEDEVLFLNAKIEDGLPLLLGWIDSRWVLSTSLNEKNLLILHLF